MYTHNEIVYIFEKACSFLSPSLEKAHFSLCMYMYVCVCLKFAQPCRIKFNHNEERNKTSGILKGMTIYHNHRIKEKLAKMRSENTSLMRLCLWDMRTSRIYKADEWQIRRWESLRNHPWEKSIINRSGRNRRWKGNGGRKGGCAKKTSSLMMTPRRSLIGRDSQIVIRKLDINLLMLI